MTIKRRLVISNILMIVIPVVISLVIALISMNVAWSVAKQVENKKQPFDFSFAEIAAQVVETLDANKDSPKLESALKTSKMNVVAYNDKGRQYQFGNNVFKYSDALINAALAIGEKGDVVINHEEVYKITKISKGNHYTICILYNWVDDRSAYDYYYNYGYTAVIIITIISIILAVILTNRSLTGFVFRKIEQSLGILADGVQEIRNGNLEHHIVYGYNDEFASICENFNDMAVRLKQSVELTQKQEQNRKELLAGISHDLRSPLTSIKAYVEGLIDGVAKTPEAQTNYMHMIKTKAEDIDHMVSKLFLFSKMDLGDYPYYPEWLDLSQEITSYIEATKEEYNAKGLRIVIEKMTPGIALYTDPIQLRSIVANIIENSLKYKDKDEAEASIFVQLKGEMIQIIIEDNGPGVPDEALHKLFDVFYRSDPSRSNPNRGSGLGLAIVAKAVSKMDGEIYAENRALGGLRIILEIPCAAKENENEKNTDY